MATRLAFPVRIGDALAERKRVSPPELAHHPHRKATRENFRFPGVVVRHSRNAAQQILDAAPEEPYSLRYAEMFLYGRIVRTVNGCGPVRSVGVRTAPEPRKEIELEVIVNVDQSREKQVTGQVQYCRPTSTLLSNGRMRPRRIARSRNSLCRADSATLAPVNLMTGSMR